MNLLTFLAVGWVIRLLMNIYYFYRAVTLKKIYEDYWTPEKNHARQYTSEIKELFQKANITDHYIGYAQPVGYNHVQSGTASVIENMFVYDQQVVIHIIGFFEQAQGTFRKRILENFNPLFWIEFILYLPKNILKYLGFNVNSLITKVIQLLYWFLSFFYSVYNEQINKIIQDFLSNFFK